MCELEALGIGRKTIVSEKKFEHLNDISLKLGIMVHKKEQIRDASIVSKSTLQEILKQYGGVQVRWKGFRVFPYGDDDWLAIDFDRGRRLGAVKIEYQKDLYAFSQSLRGVDPHRVLLSMLSNNSYLGSVEIGPDSNEFELKVNREGFIDNAAFNELKNFVRYAIDWSTIYRDFNLRDNARKEAESSRNEFEKEAGLELNERIQIKTNSSITASVCLFIHLSAQSTKADTE